MAANAFATFAEKQNLLKSDVMILVSAAAERNIRNAAE